MNKKSLLFGFFGLLVLFIGCDSEKKAEHPKKAHTSTVVTGKIESVAKPANEPGKGDDSSPIPKGLPIEATELGEDQAAKDADFKTKKSPIPKGGAISDAPAAPSFPPVSAADAPPLAPQPSSLAENSIQRAPSSSQLHEKETGLDANKGASPDFDEKKQAPGYDPSGKVDPFKPLFSSEPALPVADVERPERRTPTTPLEMIDLSQLTLVGIVHSVDSKSALVEETSGKGYIVKEGSFIGVNSGKVVQIVQDKIIVEEEIENAIGTISHEKRELKLQKPLGE